MARHIKRLPYAREECGSMRLAPFSVSLTQAARKVSHSSFPFECFFKLEEAAAHIRRMVHSSQRNV